MPSTKKRINLTVPDELYERIQKYKDENGLTNDASTCLHLIILQLRTAENSALWMKFLRETPIEDLKNISSEGLTFFKENIDQLQAIDATETAK